MATQIDNIIEEFESLNRIKMATQIGVSVSSFSALHPQIGLTISPNPCLNLCLFR